MNKITWAQMMVGQLGFTRDMGVFRILSWVNPDKATTTEMIVFIVETEIGLPGYIEKRCLKAYDNMEEEQVKRAFCHKDFPSEFYYRMYTIEREGIKKQIQDHAQKGIE